MNAKEQDVQDVLRLANYDYDEADEMLTRLLAQRYLAGWNAALEEVLNIFQADEDGDIDFLKFKVRALKEQK